MTLFKCDVVEAGRTLVFVETLVIAGRRLTDAFGTLGSTLEAVCRRSPLSAILLERRVTGFLTYDEISTFLLIVEQTGKKAQIAKQKSLLKFVKLFWRKIESKSYFGANFKTCVNRLMGESLT